MTTLHWLASSLSVRLLEWLQHDAPDTPVRTSVLRRLKRLGIQ